MIRKFVLSFGVSAALLLSGYSVDVAEAKPKPCVVKIKSWNGKKTYRYSCSVWDQPGKLKSYKLWA